MPEIPALLLAKERFLLSIENQGGELRQSGVTIELLHTYFLEATNSPPPS